MTRKYREEDRAGFGRVRSMAFRGGEAVLEDDRLLRDDCIGYVCEQDGQIVGASTALDMTANKCGVPLRCAGLAAVGVVPEMRGSGVGSAMMRDILPLLRDEGFAMASLYPYRDFFYRKFGYEGCGRRMRITCPRDRVPHIRSHMEVRELPSDRFAEIEGCYRQFSTRYAGTNERTPDQWWRTLGGDNPLQIYVAGEPIEAYIVLRLNSGFWEEQSIKEFIWTSPEGYRAMIAFLRNLSINKDTIDWMEPGDSPFLIEYLDQGVQATLNRTIMFRIVDLPTCFAALKPASSGRFTMRVHDREISENDGVWSVCFGPDGVELSRDGEPELEIGIGHLTQAFLGEPCFAELVSGGFVTGSEKGLSGAARLLQPERVFCTDFF